MPQLIVRNIEESVVRRLKKRAGEHGVSVEEEHRRILRAALTGDAGVGAGTFWKQLTEMPEIDTMLEGLNPNRENRTADGRG